MNDIFEYKTESELEDDRDTIIHNMKTIWDRYIFDHIDMLKCTEIDDDGSLIFTDQYENLREKCSKSIDMFTELQERLKEVNIALKGRDV